MSTGRGSKKSPPTECHTGFLGRKRLFDGPARPADVGSMWPNTATGPSPSALHAGLGHRDADGLAPAPSVGVLSLPATQRRHRRHRDRRRAETTAAALPRSHLAVVGSSAQSSLGLHADLFGYGSRPTRRVLPGLRSGTQPRGSPVGGYEMSRPGPLLPARPRPTRTRRHNHAPQQTSPPHPRRRLHPPNQTPFQTPKLNTSFINMRLNSRCVRGLRRDMRPAVIDGKLSCGNKTERGLGKSCAR